MRTAEKPFEFMSVRSADPICASWLALILHVG